VLFTGS